MITEVSEAVGSLYPMINGPAEQYTSFFKHKAAVARTTVETAWQALKEGWKNNKNRTLSKASVATAAGAWVIGEDILWAGSTDSLYSEFGTSAPNKAVVAAGVAAVFAAINVGATKLNMHTFESRQAQPSDRSEVEAPHSRYKRVKKALGKFGTTMLIGPPTNAVRGNFSNREAVAHSVGFGALGTALYVGANEGVNNLGPLNALDHPAVIPAIAAGVVIARYASDVCKDVAAGAWSVNPPIAEVPLGIEAG